MAADGTNEDRASREFDLLVYGATGFTGRRVAEYATQKCPSLLPVPLRVGVAGRDGPKLRDLASSLGLNAERDSIVANLDDEPELVRALRRTRVVLACAGPYRKCGMPLVRAAVKAGTDCLDLCGEPQFFDDAAVECDDGARAAGVLVVSACAFDSVPAELSAAMVARELRKRHGAVEEDGGGGDGVVSGIEICHTAHNVARGNPTTFHAAVDGFHAAATGELRASRDRAKAKFVGGGPPPKRPEGWPQLPRAPTWHGPSGTYALRFPGADASAILGSWRYLRHRFPERYEATPRPELSVLFGVPDRTSAAKALGYGAVFSSLARYKWGCDLLHTHFNMFSGGVFAEGGPTEEELKKGSFVTHCTGYGRTRNEVVRTTCTGPELGYVATPRMIVALAVTVLKHRKSLPFQGGVMLPGALFGECEDAYDLLSQNGVEFKVTQ